MLVTGGAGNGVSELYVAMTASAIPLSRERLGAHRVEIGGKPWGGVLGYATQTSFGIAEHLPVVTEQEGLSREEVNDVAADARSPDALASSSASK